MYTAVKEAVHAVFTRRARSGRPLALRYIYVVNADETDPAALLAIITQEERRQAISNEPGLFLFLSRSRSLNAWETQEETASASGANHLKENHFTIRTLAEYGIARFACTENQSASEASYAALKARVEHVLERKKKAVCLRSGLSAIAEDAERLRLIAVAEVEGAKSGSAPASFPQRIANGFGDVGTFLTILHAVYQLGRRRHADAETEVRKVFSYLWSEKPTPVPNEGETLTSFSIGSVSLRRRSDELLETLARNWENEAATQELKEVQALLRAYEVLRDLSEWLASGAHRWAQEIGEINVLVIDEALVDTDGLQGHEKEIRQSQRLELVNKLSRIEKAFRGRAEINFEYVCRPNVWTEVQNLLDTTQLHANGANGSDLGTYVQRMDFSARQPAGSTERQLRGKDLLPFDIILVEVEFRNQNIGPRMVQQMSETLERLAADHVPDPAEYGRDTAEYGRRVLPSIIVLSQSANFRHVQQCLNLGADAYVRKERIYELPTRVVRARITHRRPEPRGQKSNFRALYSLFPESVAYLQSEDENSLIRGAPHDLLDKNWIKSIPKTDLHTHIGTCIDLETIEALAFNTAGHLVVRRDENEGPQNQLKELVACVCSVVLCTSVLAQDRLAKLRSTSGSAAPGEAMHAWIGDCMETALQLVLGRKLPPPKGKDPKQWEKESVYVRVIDTIHSRHPGVNRFEVTALLVSAWFMARHLSDSQTALAIMQRRWQYLDDVAKWSEEEHGGEGKRNWVTDHVTSIVSMLEFASNDLYGLTTRGRVANSGQSLRERAALVRKRIVRTVHYLAEGLNLKDVLNRLPPAQKLRRPTPRAIRRTTKGLEEDPRYIIAKALDNGHIGPTPELRYLVAVPDKLPSSDHTLLQYLRGTELLGADHLQFPENLILAAYSVAGQMTRETVIYCELRCETTGYTEAGMGAIHATDLLCLALDVAAAWFAIKQKRIWTRFNVLLGAKRHKSEDRFKKIVALAEYYVQRSHPDRPESAPEVPDWWRPCAVAGFDLSGDENAEISKPGELIRPLFLHSAPITIHAGEAASAESIWRAVYEYGARRIGHGLRLRENTRLLNYCISEGICMELCPISNEFTNAFPSPAHRYSYESDWREYYPLRYYMERGLDVCINTDNRHLHWEGTLTDDFMCAARLVGGLTRWEILKIVKAGFKHAFLPKREIEVLLRAVESEVYVQALQ